MSNKIYIKNLAFTTTEDQLQEACSEFGQVTDVRIIKDRETQKSRGFGFVTFHSNDGAQSAIEGLNGLDFYGRQLKVETALDKNSSSGSHQINS